MLYLHIEEEHQDEPEMQKQQEERECSLCEDKFITSKEYIMYVKEHLDEIRYIDFDYLKNGCEIFNCSKCNFPSNDGKKVKEHLARHVTNHEEDLENKKIQKRNE